MKTITLTSHNILMYFESKYFHCNNIRFKVFALKDAETTIVLEYYENNHHYKQDLEQAKFLYNECDIK